MMRTTRRASAALVAILALLVGTLYPLLPVAPAQSASAAVAGEFDPGYIISDEAFYNGNDVNEAQAQDFLNWVNPRCSAGYTCLKDYRQDTWTRPADAMCGQYTGAAGEPAARILVKVAQACGISVRVLLVTLQKEQGLVTSTAPTAGKYNIAMGYACPDTAPCDAQYFGFFNQVYKGAWQLKRYGNPPGTSNYFTWYPVGSPSAVRYHPNAACGAPVITIRNKATAALYYYTPYQPNAAALANLYGTGDACSSYGNRNFFRFYSDWFGSPTQAHTPFGFLDAATSATGGIRVGGWTIDPDTAAPISVQIAIDGVVVQSFPAAIVRPDVGAAYPAYGDAHGFDRVIPASPGSHRVCAAALNVGEGTAKDLGCLTATALAGTPAPQPDLPVGAPRGWVDLVTTAPGGVRVAGWTLDPEVVEPITVHVYVDGVPTKDLAADKSHPGVAAAYPAYGGSHAFDAVIPTSPGDHTVCVYGIGYGYGGNTLLGCAAARGGTGSPLGYIDATSTAPGTLKVGGWALDLDTTSSVEISVTVNGADRGRFTADATRSDIAALYPAYGSSHGFAISLPAAGGRNTVCATAANTGAGSAASLGCVVIELPSGPPVGWIDAVTPGVGSVTVAGWGLDRDSADPISLRATVDGVVAATFVADGARPDLAGPYPGAGTNHGFSSSVPAAAGLRTVCLTAVNVGPGGDTSLGCSRVTVLTGAPSGWFDLASAGPGQILVQGWALDRDAGTGPVQVRASIDGGPATTFAASGVARPDLAGTYPGLGADHGFSAPLTAAVGRHTVCLTAVNVGAGADTSLGCLPVEVRAGSPFGYIDASARTSSGFVVGGWAIDPDLAGPVPLQVSVNGVPVASGTAGSDRPDVAKLYPGYGPAHGFSIVLPPQFTSGTACVDAVNTGTGSNVPLGCVAIR